MPHPDREIIRFTDLKKARKTIFGGAKKGNPQRAGVVRRYVYTRKREKIAFYSEPPIAGTPYKVYTDLDAFGGALFRAFKKSPLYDWYSRSTTWGGMAQAFIEVSASKSEPTQDRIGDYAIWGNIKPRRTTLPTLFFVESVDEIVNKMNTRYSIYVVNAIGVSILRRAEGM